LAEVKPLVPVIVGPTAVGKTQVAVALAEVWPVEVISADSRQIYRRLNIGTAKPEPEIVAQVPHYGLDVVDPGERYSAGKFSEDASRWLEEIPENKQPLIVGGTGLYIRALTEGLFHEPPMDRDRREKLRSWAKHAPNLARWAARLDERFEAGGRQRASRAVEVALLTGKRLSWWQENAKQKSTLRPWYVRLTAPRAFLHERIEERVKQMLERGLVDEVRLVLDGGVDPDAPGLDGVGYREVVAMLKGEIQESELLNKIVVSTRRYAKRQETWFRHQLPTQEVLTLDATDPPGILAGRIEEQWDEVGDR